MKHSKSRAARFAVMVGLCLAGGGLAAQVTPALSAPAQSPRQSTMTVVSQRTGSSLNTVPANPLVPFVITGDLFRPDKADRIGTGRVTCMIIEVSPLAVPPSLKADCHATMHIEGKGELHILSARTYVAKTDGLHFNETSLAIIGGTGDFRNARGDGTVRPKPDAAGGAIRYLIELRLTTE